MLALFLLLVGTWIWNSGHLKLTFDEFPRSLFLVFLIFVGLTIVYFFVLRLNKNYDWQIRFQFLLDALLITWLVWRTGDLSFSIHYALHRFDCNFGNLSDIRARQYF